MSISSISSNFYKNAGKAFSKTLDSNNRFGKLITKQLEKGIENPAEFAAKMMIVSFITKDAINCVLYTYQSYNNQKIPEDKRKFVAALDLMNGIFNVTGQLLAAMVIEKMCTPKWASKFTGTIKDANGGEKFVSSDAPMAADNIKRIAKQIAKEKNIDIKNVDMEAVLKQVNKSCKEPFLKGFGLIVAALGTNALIKRTLVPLVATPLAGVVKDKFMTDKKKKPDAKMTPAMVDSTMPKVADEPKKLNVVSKA